MKVCRRLRDSSVGGAEAKLSVDAMALARHLYGAKESAKSAALKAEERRRNRMYDATSKGDDDAVSEVGSSSSMSSAYFDNVNLEEWIGVRDDKRAHRAPRLHRVLLLSRIRDLVCFLFTSPARSHLPLINAAHVHAAVPRRNLMRPQRSCSRSGEGIGFARRFVISSSKLLSSVSL